MSSSRKLTKQRKQQTRLSFQPLPSSSPVKDSYSSAVQGRLASVRFNGAKSTPTRKTRASTKTDGSLPTPEPSSQPELDPDEKSPSTDNDTASVSKLLNANATSPSTSHDSEEDDIVLPPSKRRRTEQDEIDDTPTHRSSRSQTKIPTDAGISLRSRNSNGTRHVPSSPPRNIRSMSIGSPETSGDEEVVLMTQPTQRRRSTKQVQHDDPFVVSDDEDVAFSEARQRPSLVKESRRRSSPVGFVVDDDDDIEYISSESGEKSRKSQRRNTRAKQPRRSRKEQEELMDDLRDLQGSSNDETEPNEVHHEDADEQHQKLKARKTRGAPMTTQRDRARQHLEVLKRRRAGEAIPRITDSGDDFDEFDDYDGADIAEVVHDRSRGENDVLEDAFSESDLEPQSLHRDPHEAHDEDDDDDENDFIVEDEDTEIGSNRRPPTGIPLAFTSWASRKPSELFTHVVEWLVKNKIAPAFNRGDELYDLSWNRINDQIKAQAGSRLISSAWNADFKYTILARPNMKAEYIDDGYDDTFQDCDACNRTNHPARYVFRFTGRPYHPDTLEPVDEDADDSEREDDASNDQGSYDRHGHLLPSTSVSFNLGSHCAANAEMGHKLTHWKHSLNDTLLEHLEEQGVLSAEAIVAREKLSKKKREKEAENIIDMMEETGIIREMWKDLQSNLEDARFGMEDHYARGGKRNKNRIGKVRINRGEGRIEEWAEGGKMRLVAPSDSEGE